MDVVRHNHKKWYFDIRIVLMQGLKSLCSISAHCRKVNSCVMDCAKVVEFVACADCYEICSSRIIVKFGSNTFTLRILIVGYFK